MMDAASHSTGMITATTSGRRDVAEQSVYTVNWQHESGVLFGPLKEQATIVAASRCAAL